MYFFLFIFLISTTLSAQIKNNSNCNSFLSLKRKWDKEIKNWVDAKGALSIIEGLSLPNATSLYSGEKSNIYLTKNFFYDSNIEQATEAIDHQMATYSYYQSHSDIYWYMNGNKQKTKRQSKGGGRDHFIEVSSKENKYLAVKGSGTNNKFSKANASKFSIKDFRRNGLLTLEDGLLEFILSNQLKELNIPLVEHKDLIIAPEDFNKTIFKEIEKERKQKKKKTITQRFRSLIDRYYYRDYEDYEDYSFEQPRNISRSSPPYVVQMHRVLSSPRESFQFIKNSEIKQNIDKKVYSLVSSMYLNNVAHGAINPENISLDGRLLDLGHTSFGYPYISFNYRCTLCPNMEGSSSDRTMIGILDHYFGENLYSSNPMRSYSFKLKKNQHEEILRETLISLDNSIIPAQFTITQKEAEALNELYRENIRFFAFRENKDFYEQKLSQIYENLYETKISNQEKRNDFNQYDFYNKSEWNYIWPNRFSFSFKFFWQLTAQKYHLQPKEYNEFIKRIETLVAPNDIANFKTVLKTFERLSNEQGFNKSSFKKVFNELLPANLIKKRIRENLKGKTSYEEVIDISKKMINDLSKPIYYSPRKHKADLESLVEHIKRKKEEYLKKQEDILNER